uniref:Putative gustatory receptor 30 n=1 Tax=Conopomorpha sinensis TaxID=940481 RepID=A0A3S7SGR8_9NEOP|nr:putative gustatory receptor 30 [Conopomorpha sinensis]
MIIMEVGKLRLLLMRLLVEEHDPRVKEELDLFMRYTVEKPLWYRMWRAVPLDAMLPLRVVSLCTTYVIIVLNLENM